MVVCCIVESTNRGMLHDFIGNVEVICIFNEGKARLAATGVAAEENIRLNVRNRVRLAIICLLGDGLEEEVESFYETAL